MKRAKKLAAAAAVVALLAVGSACSDVVGYDDWYEPPDQTVVADGQGGSSATSQDQPGQTTPTRKGDKPQEVIH